MPEDADSPQSEPLPNSADPRRGGAAFAGETTGAFVDRTAGADKTIPSRSSNEIIGDFEVLGKLGQGGMGAVYRARQISLDRQVALKILPANLEADAEFVSRFQREARVAGSLNHANLVRVYSSGLAEGCHYIAMELVEGETLGEFVRRGPLPPTEALRICLDVAKALQCGWDRAHLIHRDIKPGNIFLSQNGEVKVGDLGLAKSMGGDSTGLTNTGTAMGTPHYISPEQSRGDKDLDFRADIYSLGCTLYQMLTGRTPYSGTDAIAVMSMHRDAPPPAILKVMPQCPIPLARLVGKMVKKAKRERQASYAELIAEIERVQAYFAPSESALESTLPPDPDATLVETPRPSTARPGSARVVAVDRRGISKPVLYGGIAATILVIAGAALVFRPKKEEGVARTEPDIRQGASERQATPATSLSQAPLPIAASPAAVSMLTKLKGRNSVGVAWEDDVVRLEKRGLSDDVSLRDVIFRASILMNPDAVGPVMHLRLTQTPGNGQTAYYITFQSATNQVLLKLMRDNAAHDLAQWTLPRRYAADDWLKLAFQVVGNKITVSADGQVLGSVHDDQISGPGRLQIYAHANGCFRDVEYVSLDGVSAPPGAQLAARESWQDLLGDSAVELRDAEHTGDGLQFNERGSAKWTDRRDGAIRFKTVFKAGLGPQAIVRWSNNGRYGAHVEGERLFISRWDEATAKVNVIGMFALKAPFVEGQEYELECYAVGSAISVKINGETYGSAIDPTYREGGVGVVVPGESLGPTRIRTVGFLDLSGSAARGRSSASPATAGEPWRNLLDDPAHYISGGVERDAEGLRLKGSAGVKLRRNSQRDGAIRVKAILTDGARPRATVRGNREGNYHMFLRNDDAVWISRWDDRTGQAPLLGEFALQKPLKKGDEYQLELRIVGQTLTGRINGEIIGSVTDTRLAAGEFGIGHYGSQTESVSIRDLEILDLDGASAAHASSRPVGTPSFTPVATGGAASREIWQDFLRDPAFHSFGKVERIAEGLRMGSASNVKIRGKVRSDGAIRLTTSYYVQGSNPQLILRTGSEGNYNLSFKNSRTVWISRWDDRARKPTVLGEFLLPNELSEGQEYLLELRAVGQTITGKVDGEIVGTATDGGLTKGEYGVSHVAAQGEPVLIRKLEYLDLEGAPGAQTTP